MKKILAVVILVLCVVSCSVSMGGSNIQDSNGDCIYVRLRNSGESVKGYMRLSIVEFTYKGHQYLWFRDSNFQSAVGGPMHDPDCEKCLKKE